MKYTEQSPLEAKHQDFINAYNRMRKGLLLVFVGWIIAAVGVTVFIGSILIGKAGFGFGVGLITSIFELLITMAVFLGMIIVAGIITLIGLWKDFLPGVDMLASVNPEFSTSRTLLKLGYFWGIILAIVSVPLLFVLVGIVTLFISAILIFLGHIGLIILAFKLMDLEGETLYLVIGILAILGIIFPILTAVALILLYVALGSSIAKRQKLSTLQVA
ncbi:MAG: hypothetical protein QW733_06770 [Desulfurococcaceae archaeon]